MARFSQRVDGEGNRLTSGYVVLYVTIVLAIVTYIHKILSNFTFYMTLHKQYPFYIAESLDKVCGALLCCIVVWAVQRRGLRGALRELGLGAPILPAVGLTLFASTPVLVTFALTRKLGIEQSAPSFLFLTILSPFVEELEFRGFGFWQLRRRAGWPFWLAILLPAILFGLGETELGQGWKQVAIIFLLTGAGSAVFSWFLEQWQNLWVLFGLHFLMDFCWGIFSASNAPLGGWFPFALQIATIMLAVLLTLLAKRRGFLPGHKYRLKVAGPQ